MKNNPKNTAKWAHILLCLIALLLLISACAKTPEDVRAWRNDKRSPIKMKEFVENEKNSLEVKAEALIVTVERAEGPEIKKIFENISDDEMNKIVEIAIPKLNALTEPVTKVDVQSEDPALIEEALAAANAKLYGNLQRVKDASYYLLDFKLSPENTSAIKGLIIKWFAGNNGDNFFTPLTKVGRVEQARLFEKLGTDAFPVFRNALNSLFAEIKKVGPDLKYSEPLQLEMKEKILDPLKTLKLEGTNDFLADIFISEIDKEYPNIPEVYFVPLLDNDSDKILPLAERLVFDPEYKNDYLNVIKMAILTEYYPTVRPNDAIEVYKKIIQTDKTGMMRWNAAWFYTESQGKASVEPFLNALPDDITLLDIPADHPSAAKYAKGSFFWSQSEVYCRSLVERTNNQVPMDILRKYAATGRTVERLLSMLCISYIGNQQDMELLNALTKDKTSMENWNFPNAKTLGEFAQLSVDAFAPRHEQERVRAENIKKAAEKNKTNTQTAQNAAPSANNAQNAAPLAATPQATP